MPNAPFIPGNEDCLFLNVNAPSDARNLPVLVWIHGGGYGLGDGTQDMSEIIAANRNGFVAVTIQYRVSLVLVMSGCLANMLQLGAFGFLSSSEIKSNGVTNAGILDMAFALTWVQKYITKFGGDPAKVTISGESAGAGGVLLLGIVKDGSLGTSLFQNVSAPNIGLVGTRQALLIEGQSIAASPYLPAQYDYNAAIPTQRYQNFVSQAGCTGSSDVLACLRSKDSTTLQQAKMLLSLQRASTAPGHFSLSRISPLLHLVPVLRSRRSVSMARSSSSATTRTKELCSCHPLSPRSMI